MLIDVHVHSPSTDGVEVDARTILERAREQGLDGVCFTDRNSTSQAVDLIRLGAEVGVEVFIGLEINTDHGVLLCFAPRIDAFYLQEEWRSVATTGTPIAQRVIDLFESIGGAVVAAHPYDMTIPWAMGDRLFELQGLNAIQTYVPRLPGLKNPLAIEAAQALGVSAVGGSDFRGNLEQLGQAATLFLNPVSTQREFVEALRGQDYWATAIGIDPGRIIPDPSIKDRPRSEGGRGGRDGGRGGRGGRDGGRGGRGGRDGGRGGRDGGRGGRDGGRGGRDGGRGGRDGGRGGRDGGRGGRDGGRGGRDGGRGGRGGRDGGRGRSGEGRGRSRSGEGRRGGRDS